MLEAGYDFNHVGHIYLYLSMTNWPTQQKTHVIHILLTKDATIVLQFCFLGKCLKWRCVALQRDLKPKSLKLEKYSVSIKTIPGLRGHWATWVPLRIYTQVTYPKWQRKAKAKQRPLTSLYCALSSTHLLIRQQDHPHSVQSQHHEGLHE